ncbi:4-amino-4-deoxy-L-arabinose transferase [Tistlia consotensis]|uniref:4-amino-4-deoxy-L-arabinose transferase n=1 Tax=Tistlia consotensis USBA 355 TaxID=560819 RepID=A0A1Y6BJR6_9PROT|nr:glycosyltransferase family 39 protein [Tistlia consotensis]SMF14442.1 4-amino-4-deoxy-L-arabinose transferase [Tistlia consotensis USBA 355]SNR49536.1 4-amino-4-deoxy-L-arabinose transferase [Tistlia consotensis]
MTEAHAAVPPVPPKREPTLWLQALLLLVALAFFLPGFFQVPPVDRDEARFAQASKQMIESGDVVDIRFQDAARLNKPVGIYWAQVAAATAWGALTLQSPAAAPIWVYRLPSLLGACLAVLLTFRIGRRLFGSSAGALAALMMAGCLLLGVEARTAKTDALLLATILLAQSALAELYMNLREGRPSSARLAIAFWAGVGLAALIKGPIVLLVAGGTIAGLLVFERRAAWLRGLKPWPWLLLALAIFLPWLVAIAIQTHGAFFAESVGHDLLGKVAGGQESHGAPPGLYLVLVFLTFWPFSLLLGLAVPWTWLERRRPAVVFCLAWLIPSWIVFELVPTKLPHYVLPLYPALAILVAAAVRETALAPAALAARGWASWLRFATLLIFLAITLLLAAGLVAVPLYLEGTLLWAGLAGALLLCVLAFAVIRLRPQRGGTTGVAVLALGAWLLYLVGWPGVVPNLSTIWLSPRIAAAVAANRPCDDSVLASSGYSEPSLIFLTGTGTRLGRPPEAAATLTENPACNLALVSSQDDGPFRAALGDAAAKLTSLATIEGLNYSKGKRLTLQLYRLAE